MVKRTRRKILLGVSLLLLVGMIMPQRFKMPVQGAGKRDYNQASFWFYPWGKSSVHKGVDVFAKKGTPIHASTGGIVVYAGEIAMGGKVVYVLGPKWRLHYYAHLDEIHTKSFKWVGHRTSIGTVGTSGNAAGKSPHLHYSIKTLLPYVWRVDNSVQGWKKMLYLNPTDYLNEYVDSAP